MGLIDWNAFKMTRAGQGSLYAWNALVDACATLQINSVIGGTAQVTYGVGTDLVISPSSGGGATPSWNWKLSNTTKGSSGQVQLNGGDGFAASLNSFICNVNGSPNDTASGGPPATYPQLAITGNGTIYGYAVPTTPGDASELESLDLYYGGTVPSPDTAAPATYYPFLVGTVTGYTTDAHGNPSFTVNNATNYGWTQLIYCGGAIQIY